MRKVTFGGANSLDNFIAREDEAIDWLLWSEEANAVMKDFWAKIDTLVMGRKTYEAGLKYSGGKYPYKMKCYVFSRTLPASKDGFVQIVSGDAVEFVRDLKQQEGKEICMMGGGLFAKSLFEADLIDEIGFNVHPVLLGSGIPLFHRMGRQIELELLECRPFKNGCVYLSYRVKH